MTAGGAGPVPSGGSSVPISGRAVAAGGVLPALLYLAYKYGLVGHLGWPAMPELEAVLPGLAVATLAWIHHRANRARERRDRTFLLKLVAAGIVIPVPPNPYAGERAAAKEPASGSPPPREVGH